jgi:drug/metabolite transporter (DMT)-like permease
VPSGVGRYLPHYAFCAFIWGTTWIAIKFNLDDMPRFTSLGLRLLIASLLYLGAARWQGLSVPWSGRDLGLYSFFALAIHTAPLALIYTASGGASPSQDPGLPSGLTAVLFSTLPLFVAVGGHFFVPGERLTIRRGIGVVLGFVGVAVIYAREVELGLRDLSWRMSLVILASLLTACGNLVLKRVARDYALSVLNGATMAIGAGAVLAAAIVAERDVPVRWTVRGVGTLLYLAVAGSVVAYSVYYWLIQRIEVTRLALMAFATPVIAVTIGTVVGGEPLSGGLVSGGSLVLAGIGLVLFSPTIAPQPPVPETDAALAKTINPRRTRR